jgi:hypothetical protein
MTGVTCCEILCEIFQTWMIRTDHMALKWLFSLKEPKGREARWIEILSAYDFEIQ